MVVWRRVWLFFFFQAEDGIRDLTVTGVQTCALPISGGRARVGRNCVPSLAKLFVCGSNSLRPRARRPQLKRDPLDGHVQPGTMRPYGRSEEHTSELQSQSNLVCRLLLAKKNTRRPAR